MSIETIRALVVGNNLKEAIGMLSETTKAYSKGIQSRGKLLQIEYTKLNVLAAGGVTIPNDWKLLELSILEFLDYLETLMDNGQVLMLSADKILQPNRYPFIDRKNFREKLKELLGTEGGKLLFVKGNGKKSGISYLENYLNHLSILSDLYAVVRINIADMLDSPGPNKSADLVRMIASGLNLPFEYSLENIADVKFTNFISKFKETYATNSKIPIIYIHDFQRMQVMPDVNNLIQLFADAFSQDFPKTIVIIGGMEYEALINWEDDLQFRSEKYNIESVEVEHVQECIHEIFDRFKEKIAKLLGDTITKEDYTDEMINRLIPDKPAVDLVAVGKQLKSHLLQLRNT